MSDSSATPASAQPAGMRGSGRTADSRLGLGVALIVFGMIALGARLVPGVSWAAMWPLLFVAGGLVQMITPSWATGWTAKRFAEGLGTVFFGVALLGCTTGYLEWGMWLTMLSLWPLLLVVAGLNLLGKASGQSWLHGAATLVVWGALLFSAAGSWTGRLDIAPLPPIFEIQTMQSPDAAAQRFSETIVESVAGPMDRLTY